ncbi:hypothetical protein P3S68_003112 [Capsicum galapagoense]
MEKAFTSFLLTLLTLLLLHYVMVGSAMTQTNATTDKLALLSLKSQIISDPFHFLDESWSPTTFSCHWVGVTYESHHQQVKSLNLSSMALTGKIHREFGNLSFLSSLDLVATVSREFCLKKCSFSNVSTLETLNLNFNSIEGQIPKVIGSLINLRELKLRVNKHIGSIALSLSNASRLETLDISYNSLQGNIPEGIGINMNRIEIIGFTGNSLSGNLPNGLCNGLPILKGLYLSKNNLHGHMPTSLSNCSKLQRLSLSINDFDGPIHSEIGRLTNLQFLYLRYNQFTGEIPKEKSNLIELEELNIPNNRFSGPLPTEIFNISGNLIYLSLSFNPLNGMLPASMGNLSTSLTKFFAGSCKIQGRIPNEVGNLSSLLFLDISGNNLVGSFPTSIGNLRNLQRFNLSNNKLTGFFGDHICKLQRLGDIYLDQNQLSGSLPNCLGNITSLREIHVGSNKLSSNMPPSLGNLQDIFVLDLSSNNMVDSLPPEIGNLKVATLIDLAMNQFSNEIPREIGGLRTLVHLSLKHNKLQGSIPNSVSNMVGFEFLDLSHNNISGTIPKSLEKLQNLKYFNVSFLYLLLGFIFLFASIILVCVWIRYRRRKRAPQQADSLASITREIISYYELLQATDTLSESNLIGSRSFSSVYKGILTSGTAIAVKVFNLQVDKAFKSFDMECEVLRNLRHRNLVKVINSCSNLDFKSLLLDYMPNVSLEKYLYSHNYFLYIKQKLSIMIDVACALEYLHHGCTLPVIHYDVKPSNILLDEDMVAHLSDFGILKLLGEDESDLFTKTLATLGYIAPDGLVSAKCDVYSYGIMLLETFTRRKPNDFEGDQLEAMGDSFTP